jgi:hypothetical protein
MRTRCNVSLVRLGALLALGWAVAACTPGGQFDPSTLLDNDMFNNKKPLTGQREPVFPNGVPGAATGIPPDLVKGYQPPPQQAADAGGAPGAGDAVNTGAARTPVNPPAEEPPPPKADVQAKPKPKAKVARKPSPPRTEISVGLTKHPQPAAQQQPAQTDWPAPPSTAQKEPSQSVWPTPPPTAQPSQSVWPNPPPTGGAQQAAQPSGSIWPNPPATQ